MRPRRDGSVPSVVVITRDRRDSLRHTLARLGDTEAAEVAVRQTVATAPLAAALRRLAAEPAEAAAG